MEKNYAASTAVCPFYLYEETQRIHCEGFCKGTKIQLFFDHKRCKSEHKKKYCHRVDGYEKCPLNSVIMAQYKEVEKDE